MTRFKSFTLAAVAALSLTACSEVFAPQLPPIGRPELRAEGPGTAGVSTDIRFALFSYDASRPGAPTVRIELANRDQQEHQLTQRVGLVCPVTSAPRQVFAIRPAASLYDVQPGTCAAWFSVIQTSLTPAPTPDAPKAGVVSMTEFEAVAGSSGMVELIHDGDHYSGTLSFSGTQSGWESWSAGLFGKSVKVTASFRDVRRAPASPGDSLVITNGPYVP